nr:MULTISPECIES: hypothetical protein [unclassified Butyricicoccus]
MQQSDIWHCKTVEKDTEGKPYVVLPFCPSPRMPHISRRPQAALLLFLSQIKQKIAALRRFSEKASA